MVKTMASETGPRQRFSRHGRCGGMAPAGLLAVSWPAVSTLARGAVPG
jgi:hypothetical protein